MNNVEDKVITVSGLKHFKETYLDPSIEEVKNSSGGGTQWYQHEIVMSYDHTYTDEETGEEITNSNKQFSLTFMSLLESPVDSLYAIISSKPCFLIDAISPEFYDVLLFPNESVVPCLVDNSQRFIVSSLSFIKIDFTTGTPWDIVTFELDTSSPEYVDLFMGSGYYSNVQFVSDNVTKL